tara:strand:+ start:103 stop:423 length:321 start_codon:yes stop_codon:yes gene_type:complete
MIDLSYMIPDMKTNTDKNFIPIRKDQIEDIEKELRTEERKNRFNGESIMLTKEEADKHDAIFMHELMATIEDKTLGQGASKHWQEMRNLLSWFMKHNAKAYMVLLD